MAISALPKARWARPMMALEDVCLRGRENWRVDHVSLSLHPGEVLALLGPNGAGKSSLLKLLAGEIPCDRGRVCLGGTDIGDLSAKTLALHRAVLPQESVLAFSFRVRDVVLMGRNPHRGCGDAIDQDVATWAMDLTDVLPMENRDYTQLSGGERQRVQLARVLAQIGPKKKDNRFLLLDEPTAALDLAHQHLLLGVAKQLAITLKIGVLAILHDLNLAALYANRIALIKAGRLEAVGLPEDVLSSTTISNVFSMDTSVVPHPHRPERYLVVTR